MTELVKVGSHRASEKLVKLLGYLPRGYFSYRREGEWREIPADKLGEALTIKGIQLAKRQSDLKVFLSGNPRQNA